MLARPLFVVALVLSLTDVCHATLPSPDPAFGSFGTAILTLGELGGLVSSLAVQPDGKPVIGYGNIIPVGGFGAPFGTQGFLSRLNPDGTVDTSLFGGPIAEYEVPRVLVQRDGKILMLISRTFARYLPDGTLDGPYTFNAASATNAFDAGFTFADLAIQADGKVVVVGRVGTTNGLGEGSQGVEVVRFNTNGTLDTSFGASGHVRIPVMAGFDDPVGIVALPQGNIGVAFNHQSRCAGHAVHWHRSD
jgi:uncharacterized delta-60 repeat protein